MPVHACLSPPPSLFRIDQSGETEVILQNAVSLSSPIPLGMAVNQIMYLPNLNALRLFSAQ